MPQSSIGLNWAVFGYAIKCERERRGLSQRALCEKIPGLSSPVLSRIERGFPAELGPYLLICKGLDVHPYQIIEIGSVTVGELIAASRQTEDA